MTVNNKNTYFLGIDAGGTNTDIVLLDMSETDKKKSVIAYTKASTDYQNPAKGIKQALGQINSKFFQEIEMVSMATTFATNALVENRGPKTGIILIGFDQSPQTLKDFPILHIQGGHKPSGQEKCPLDHQALENKLPEFLAELEAVAIAGFFSVRNAEHEKYVGEIIKNKFKIPYICSHTLSQKLHADKRAVTALWNARLSPIIQNLILALEEVLAENKINAPLMLVRSDGSLMSAEQALLYPIETILSGPAASILGAAYLTDINDALVADMGGTTTDMGLIIDKKIALSSQGVQINSWSTSVEGPQINTIGLGGDCLIYLDDYLKINIMPRRIKPIGVYATSDPQVMEILNSLENLNIKVQRGRGTPALFFKNEQELCHAYRIGSNLEDYEIQKHFQKALLSEHGEIIGLTPTDFSIAMHKTNFGNVEASQKAIDILAKSMEISAEELYSLVLTKMKQIIQKEAFSCIDKECSLVINQLDLNLLLNKHPYIQCQPQIKLPIVFIGAPAKVYGQAICKDFASKVLSPDLAQVGVAIGSVTGIVDIYLIAFIRPLGMGYRLFVDTEIFDYSSLDEAKKFGKDLLYEKINEKMQNNQVSEPLIEYEESEISSKSGMGEILMEVLLKVRGKGRPSLKNI